MISATVQTEERVTRPYINSLKHVCAPYDTERQDAIDYAFYMGIVELCGDPLIDAQMIALSWDEIMDAFHRHLDDEAAKAECMDMMCAGLATW